MRSFAESFLLLFVALTAFAQGDRGTITGTVADPANAMVAGAVVSARNTETGAQYDTVTTATGNYTLSSLPAGVYEVIVSAPGFSKSVQQGLRVQVAMTIRVDVILKVGSTNESITVSAAAALIRTENAEQSQTISGERINNLPLNFGVIAGGYLRSPFAFMNLTPGALQSGQNVMRVNGVTNNVTMRIEGQDATNTNSNSRIDELQPSVEAVQEFTLQTSNFSAEYGQVGGGIFNFTTKSGTNQYHGTAYENFSNEALNAGAPWTDDGNGHLVRPRARKHDFGFSAGGPIRIPRVYNGKNRTFFFGNIEFYRDTKIASGTYQTVPTLAMRNGDFSGVLTGKQLTSGGRPAVDPLGANINENVIYDPGTTATLSNGSVVRTPFPGNIIPQNTMDPVALGIQKLIPLPTNNLAVNNWQQVYPNNKQMNVPSIKIDHSLNDKMKASFYFSRFSTNQYVNPDGLPVPLTQLRILYERNDTWRSNYDYTISPTMVLHVGIGYIRYRNPDVMVEGVKNYDAVGQLGLKGSVLTPSGFPRITGLSGSLGGMGLNMGPSNGNLYFEDKPTANASLSYIRGNHSYKLGADWRIDVWTNRAYNQAIGNYTFGTAQTGQPSTQASPVSGGSVGYGYASFLLGSAASATVGPPGDPQYRRKSYSLFLQDTWKVTRKLTLDYGIRWDQAMPTREIHNRWSAFSPNVANPSAGGLLGATIYEGFGAGRCNCQFTDVYPYAIGPRIGGAYQLTPKTVLRGGWGLTYTPLIAFGYLGFGSALGTGWSTLSFSPNNSWDPALLMKNGMQYNLVRSLHCVVRSRNSAAGRPDQQSSEPDRSQQRASGPRQPVESVIAARSLGEPCRRSGLRRQPRRVAQRQCADGVQQHHAATTGGIRSGHQQCHGPHSFAQHHHQRRRCGARLQAALRQLSDGSDTGPGAAPIPTVRRPRSYRSSSGQLVVRRASGQGHQTPLSRPGADLFLHMAEGTGYAAGRQRCIQPAKPEEHRGSFPALPVCYGVQL